MQFAKTFDFAGKLRPKDRESARERKRGELGKTDLPQRLLLVSLNENVCEAWQLELGLCVFRQVVLAFDFAILACGTLLSRRTFHVPFSLKKKNKK